MDQSSNSTNSNSATSDNSLRRIGWLLIWYWLPLVIYAGTIYFLSSLSHPSIPVIPIPNFDKAVHFTEYLGFGILLCRGLVMGGEGIQPRSAFFWTMVLGAVYGASDEIHQYFVPLRSSDIYDFMSDGVGAFCGGWLYKIFIRRMQSKVISTAQ